MSDDTTSDNQTEAAEGENKQPRDFGLPLRQARMASGLSLQDAADELKLDEKILLSIEDSDLESLPSQAYTQGYIRGYARLLKISPDEILQQYLAANREESVELKPSSGYELQQHKQSQAFRIVSLGLVVVLIAFIVAWLWGQSDTTPQDFSQSDTQAPAPADTGNAGSAAQMPADTTEAAAETEAAQVSQADDTPTSDTTSTDTATETVPSPAPSTTSSGDTGATAETPASTDSLSMTASAASWAEVSDADDNRLYFRLMSENEHLNLSGRAPFRIFLGNAPEVSIELNGDKVDISPFIRSNRIAYIQVDKNGKISPLKRNNETSTAE